jgi:hypothetical protein
MMVPASGLQLADLPAGLTAAEVSEFLNALDKAVRARRLYAPNNPAYCGFLNNFKNTCKKLWQIHNSLSVVVDESAFTWDEQTFVAGEGRENLAFFFYKDGIRLLTFSTGFEDEAEGFIEIVARARHADRAAADDLVTLLWEHEFTALQYSYVDALAEGIEVPETGPIAFEKIELTLVAEDINAPFSSDPSALPFAISEGLPPVAQLVSRDDFVDTLYFLETSELDYLRAEVEKEWQRDIKRDVINALFDRIEDPIPQRQTEILSIVRQLLPGFLSGGDLRSAALILDELTKAMASPDILGEPQKQQGQEILDDLSDPTILTVLLKSLEEGAIDPSGQELSVFLLHLRPEALPPLIQLTETTFNQQLQARLRIAIEGLGRAHPAIVIGLLKDQDEIIVAGAARLAGQIGLPALAPHVAHLLTHTAAAVRRAAVDALVAIKSGTALDALLQKALEDPERDVRIAVARGIATLRYQPARPRLEAALQGKIVRDADLTEQIAFFEAYGAVANAESVAMLDRMLNGKKLLGKLSPEMRACAAMALGRVLGSAASREALMRAKDDTNPMVRNAVHKALRQEQLSA